jgi:glucosamine 6-phosphate synthetase-like amidotransferase/phosphosugar isomerase protein
MCGIFGYVSDKEINLGPILIEADERLTYRGYDSVGAATLAWMGMAAVQLVRLKVRVKKN